MSDQPTIRATDLLLLIAAAKMRRYTGGRTCQLCALSGGAMIETDCRSSRSLRETAQRVGISPARVYPMQRGEIGQVFERVQRQAGRREVLRTWGAGVRALHAEPRYVLNGGSAS